MQKREPGLPPDYRDCKCRKSLYFYENGKDHVESAKTRSWEEAERIAQAELDLRDPGKRKVRELQELLAAKEAEAAAQTLTFKEATDRWFEALKVTKEGTKTVHRSVVKRILAWAEDNNIQTVAHATPDNLDKWRAKCAHVSDR